MAGFDFSNFFRQAKEAASKQLQAAVNAVDKFGEQVKGDAQDIAPVGGGLYSPNDPAPGTLKASATAEPAVMEGEMIVKRIGFNTAYAAVQHEDLEFRHDQGEAQFLTSSLRGNQDKFGPFVAKRVKEANGD